jgi:hypothetical protein
MKKRHAILGQKALTKEEKLAFMNETMRYMANGFANDPQKLIGEMMPVCMNMMKSRHGHRADARHDQEHDGIIGRSESFFSESLFAPRRKSMLV